MQQINIESDRIGFDGVRRSWNEIERAHKHRFCAEIRKRLKELVEDETKNPNPDKKRIKFLKWCWKNTSAWMVAKPIELKKVKDEVQNSYRFLLVDATFHKKVADAYGYAPRKLLNLAKMLNIKTCPYCNMQYTLYAAAYEEDSEKTEEIAKFQFDHFFPQSDYPMLSMSLYNLIPSCASCNQGKSNRTTLNLDFHPYHASIADKFHFRVSNPTKLWMGSDRDVPKIELVPDTHHDISSYNTMFKIEMLYQRHKDVAREVFARAYADKYYKDVANFPFLFDVKLKERIKKGFYPDIIDINKRPLTKLQQDLWHQAKGEL